MGWKKWILLVVSTAIVLGVVGATGLGVVYNKKVDTAIEKIHTDSTFKPKPEEVVIPPDPRQGDSLNILLLGSDARPSDHGRSDSIMLAHIPSNRQNVYLISIPRDVQAEIPGYGVQKVNAAYAYGGVALTVNTVSTLAGVPIDHVAVIDFQGFIDLVDALGGVTINNPYEACDWGQDVCWEAGTTNLDSEEALQYVRWRKGLPNGDITRGQNQQRVLKAIMGKLLSAGTLTNPTKFGESLETVATRVTVDEDLDRDTIKGIGLSMRITSRDDVRSITYPISGYENDPVLGSMDIPDYERVAELQEALKSDTFEQYWLDHKDDPVAGYATVQDEAGDSVKSSEEGSETDEEVTGANLLDSHQ